MQAVLVNCSDAKFSDTSRYHRGWRHSTDTGGHHGLGELQVDTHWSAVGTRQAHSLMIRVEGARTFGMDHGITSLPIVQVLIQVVYTVAPQRAQPLRLAVLHAQHRMEQTGKRVLHVRRAPRYVRRAGLSRAFVVMTGRRHAQLVQPREHM